MEEPGPNRPNLLPTAALVSLLVLLLGAGALFALSYTNQQSSVALERLGRFHAAQISAVQALVSFKTQVQEWKDVLLRGHDPKDYAAHLASFNAREQEVLVALQTVQNQLAALGFSSGNAPADSAMPRAEAALGPERVAKLLSEHHALGVRYRAELASHDFASRDVAFQIDRDVRGVDRSLHESLDRLAHDVAAASERELANDHAAANARYATLRKVTLVLGALAVLGAFTLVFQAVRIRGAGRTP